MSGFSLGFGFDLSKQQDEPEDSTEPPIPGPKWILANGKWDDQGVWDDAATWKDAP